MRPGDSPSSRKHRGAFFTPPAIASFLADWAVAGDPAAKILDPTCGEAVFLIAASEGLRKLGTHSDAIEAQVSGVDLHAASLRGARDLLEARGLSATLHEADFFDVPTPAELGSPGWQDAVIGNPPFVRYQKHTGMAAMGFAFLVRTNIYEERGSYAYLRDLLIRLRRPDGPFDATMLLSATWDEDEVVTEVEDASEELTAARFFEDLIRAVTTNTPVTVHSDVRLRRDGEPTGGLPSAEDEDVV